MVSQLMQGYFINFIKHGNPNGLDIVGSPIPTWEKIMPWKPQLYLSIGLHPKVESDTSEQKFILLKIINPVK